MPLLLVLLMAAPAAADQRRKPQPPPTPHLQLAPGGDARLTQLVNGHAGALVACAARSMITGTLRASFDHGGRARTVVVRSDGGRAFERCVERALRGKRSARKGASGPRQVRFVIDAAPGQPVPAPPPRPPIVVPPPAPPMTPKPAPPPSGLQACRVDADCTVHYRSYGCIPGDPVAVNVHADRAAVQARFPVSRQACGMGGPQYDRLRMSFDGRYGATCRASRCEVVDHGPRPSPLDGLRREP